MIVKVVYISHIPLYGPRVDGAGEFLVSGKRSDSGANDHVWIGGSCCDSWFGRWIQGADEFVVPRDIIEVELIHCARGVGVVECQLVAFIGVNFRCVRGYRCFRL